MKVHNTLKELLEAWEAHRFRIVFENDVKASETMYEDFIASNSLALGKPEPLAKNKHTQKFCECKNGPTGRTVTEDFEHQICDTCGLIAK